jgi:hypothetical protein
MHTLSLSLSSLHHPRQTNFAHRWAIRRSWLSGDTRAFSERRAVARFFVLPSEHSDHPEAEVWWVNWRRADFSCSRFFLQLFHVQCVSWVEYRSMPQYHPREMQVFL